jgi:hypothetical protein
MRLSELCSLKTPEPSVPKTPAPVPESDNKKPKIKNLPTLTYEQQERKLVNDQELLKQLRTKIGIYSIQSESVSESESESEPEPEPESEPATTLNQASNDNESETSAPLLYLPAKIKHAEIHFMIDSGATNNFLSQDFVRRHNLPTHLLKKPFCINFADGRS